MAGGTRIATPRAAPRTCRTDLGLNYEETLVCGKEFGPRLSEYAQLEVGIEFLLEGGIINGSGEEDGTADDVARRWHARMLASGQAQVGLEPDGPD